jgi:O-methyltransferase involved in polyketide biosynthesis
MYTFLEGVLYFLPAAAGGKTFQALIVAAVGGSRYFEGVLFF